MNHPGNAIDDVQAVVACRDWVTLAWFPPCRVERDAIVASEALLASGQTPRPD